MTARTVRLWWRCTLCRHRFDTFGTDHKDGLAPAAWDALDHLHSRHGVDPATITEASHLIRSDGATSRVVRRSVIVAR